MKSVKRGILIHRSSWSETSLIVTILCEKQGLSTFLFQGGKKKKGTMLFPMAHVEFTFYRRNDSAMGKISELNLVTVSTSIPFDPVKSGIAFFLAELVQHVTRTGHPEDDLYRLLEQENRWLDASEELTNYPLWFLAAFSRTSGIIPSVEEEHTTVFDLLGGKLTTVRPLHVQYEEGSWIQWIEASLMLEKTTFLSLAIPKPERLMAFNAWLRYYQIHVPGMRELKSVEVVRELMG